MIYLCSAYRTNTKDIRTHWYLKNYALLQRLSVCLLLVFVGCLTLYILQYDRIIFSSYDKWYLVILVLPITAILYSLPILSFVGLRSFREYGMLKPFALGFIWSSMVSYMPVVFYNMQTLGSQGNYISPNVYNWLIDWLFISILCILFDYKDCIADQAQGINTFPVRFGITKTTVFIIIPLVMLIVIIMIALTPHTLYLIIRLIPLLLIVLVSFSLNKPKNIIYYLLVVDGLMLVKVILSLLIKQ